MSKPGTPKEDVSRGTQTGLGPRDKGSQREGAKGGGLRPDRGEEATGTSEREVLPGVGGGKGGDRGQRGGQGTGRRWVRRGWACPGWPEVEREPHSSQQVAQVRGEGVLLIPEQEAAELPASQILRSQQPPPGSWNKAWGRLQGGDQGAPRSVSLMSQEGCS